MKGQKRMAAIDQKLEKLEIQMTLKLISGHNYHRKRSTLVYERSEILYKYYKDELDEIEAYIKYLERHADGLKGTCLAFIAENEKQKLRLVESMIRGNVLTIKRLKKSKTTILDNMRRLSKIT